jgi:hypothetical protein
MAIIEKSRSVGFDDRTVDVTGKPVRALCVHGHFYQPPRENPVTGIIPNEIGAAPYPNWNERIHRECYQPNAKLGNFERISFNVGPTLFNWMQKFDPITTRRIVAQDQSNVKRFGIGNALAQAYHHTILPLASRKDKDTQVYWSVADFKQRFGRQPEGMWLPETAVDIETLEVLVDHGIQFTILAPWQSAERDINPTEPYWIRLPSRRSIAVFFYQEDLSGGISFDQRMTTNAYLFALNELVRFFDAAKYARGEDQLLLIASDGELYGHHQAFRDWFLAYLVNGAGARAGIQLTYPGLWLKNHPPKHQVQIRERTSWSCHHGLMRWQNACDCTPGDSTWKGYLRFAFDNFAREVDRVYETALQQLGINPWKLRNSYIQFLLENASLEEIVLESREKGASTVYGNLDAQDLAKVGMLLEAQRERMRMYTSCGWFFDDFNRIEPQNNVAYAAQAANLIFRATGADLTRGLMGDLSKVISQRFSTTADEVFDRFWRTYY